jgi:hypothetical protein
MSNKPLRQTMPATAAFIDDLRAAFGADTINPAIKAGIDGQPTFWAQENGQEIGTKPIYSPERSVKVSDMQLSPKNATAPHHASRKGK